MNWLITDSDLSTSLKPYPTFYTILGDLRNLPIHAYSLERKVSKKANLNQGKWHFEGHNSDLVFYTFLESLELCRVIPTWENGHHLVTSECGPGVYWLHRLD